MPTKPDSILNQLATTHASIIAASFVILAFSLIPVAEDIAIARTELNALQRLQGTTPEDAYGELSIKYSDPSSTKAPASTTIATSVAPWRSRAVSQNLHLEGYGQPFDQQFREIAEFTAHLHSVSLEIFRNV
jgi:hypothetical protein